MVFSVAQKFNQLIFKEHILFTKQIGRHKGFNSPFPDLQNAHQGVWSVTMRLADGSPGSQPPFRTFRSEDHSDEQGS